MLSAHEISTLLVLRHSPDTSAVGLDRLALLEERGLIEPISVDGVVTRSDLTEKGTKVLGDLERSLSGIAMELCQLRWSDVR
jgi:hypothetical protein